MATFISQPIHALPGDGTFLLPPDSYRPRRRRPFKPRKKIDFQSLLADRAGNEQAESFLDADHGSGDVSEVIVLRTKVPSCRIQDVSFDHPVRACRAPPANPTFTSDPFYQQKQQQRTWPNTTRVATIPTTDTEPATKATMVTLLLTETGSDTMETSDAEPATLTATGSSTASTANATATAAEVTMPRPEQDGEVALDVDKNKMKDSRDAGPTVLPPHKNPGRINTLPSDGSTKPIMTTNAQRKNYTDNSTQKARIDVRKKLGDSGVTVTKASPAPHAASRKGVAGQSPRAEAKPWHTKSSYSNLQKPKQANEIKRSVTGNQPAKANVNGWGGTWDDLKPSVPTTDSGPQLSHEIAPVNGQGGKKSALRKKKDLPKPSLQRHDRDWDCGSKDANGGLCLPNRNDEAQAGGENDGSVRADAGWDHEMRPPDDWENRPGFIGQFKESDSIRRWVDAVNEAISGFLQDFSVEEIETADGTISSFAPKAGSSGRGIYEHMGDIVPAFWIPITIEDKAPQTFWNELVKSAFPLPVDSGDLDNVKPWWDILARGRKSMDDPTFPLIKGIDPDESSEERLKRENDQGSLRHALNRRDFEWARKQAKREINQRRAAKDRKLKARSVRRDPISVQQGLKMYIRSARPGDLEEIRKIYNYYVSFSCVTAETEEISVDEMTDRYRAVVDAKLPFLVAVERGDLIKARRNKRNPHAEDIILPDKIIGFAFAADFDGGAEMYQYTARAELYTRDGYCAKGIGKCLMDKLLSLLNPEWVEHGGYEIIGDELGDPVPRRAITNIVINFLFERQEVWDWVSKWLVEWAQFKDRGMLEGMGFKLGRSISLAIFQHNTGVELDYANPPPV